MTFAYVHIHDGKTWVRIVDGPLEWDEPISGWERILDLINGGMYLRNGKREYIEGETNWRDA